MVVRQLPHCGKLFLFRNIDPNGSRIENLARRKKEPETIIPTSRRTMADADNQNEVVVDDVTRARRGNRFSRRLKQHRNLCN